MVVDKKKAAGRFDRKNAARRQVNIFLYARKKSLPTPAYEKMFTCLRAAFLGSNLPAAFFYLQPFLFVVFLVF